MSVNALYVYLIMPSYTASVSRQIKLEAVRPRIVYLLKKLRPFVVRWLSQSFKKPGEAKSAHKVKLGHQKVYWYFNESLLVHLIKRYFKVSTLRTTDEDLYYQARTNDLRIQLRETKIAQSCQRRKNSHQK